MILIEDYPVGRVNAVCLGFPGTSRVGLTLRAPAVVPAVPSVSKAPQAS